MKIDQEYLKHLLEIARRSPRPTFTIEDFDEAGVPHDTDAFEFHMQIINEQRLIVQDDGDYGFGMVKSIDGFRSWSVLPLRLSADGHEFIEALENVDVWTTIKRDFRDASIKTLKDVGLQLLEGYVKKKVNGLIGD
jgi:hypothetical protein